MKTMPYILFLSSMTFLCSARDQPSRYRYSINKEIDTRSGIQVGTIQLKNGKEVYITEDTCSRTFWEEELYRVFGGKKVYFLDKKRRDYILEDGECEKGTKRFEAHDPETNKCIGNIMVRPEKCRISCLNIAKEYRKQGIAQKLVELSTKYLREECNCKDINLVSTGANLFWEKLGAKRIDENDHYVFRNNK